jgi:hypothetical protein
MVAENRRFTEQFWHNRKSFQMAVASASFEGESLIRDVLESGLRDAQRT